MARKYHKLLNGTGYTMHQGPDGFWLDIDHADAAAVLDFPFKVKTKKATSGYDVYVRPGTVNNFVPKISGTYLDADTPPSFNFTSVGSSGKKIVAIKVTKDGVAFFPSTVEIVLVDSESDIASTNTIGYIQVASITCTTTGGLKVKSINQFVYASQIVTRVKPGSSSAVWTFTSR